MNSCTKPAFSLAHASRAGRWGWLALLLLVGHIAHADWPQATNLWTFQFAKPDYLNSTLSSPAVAPNGTIYIGTFTGALLALAPDGKEQWHFKAGREIKSSPAIGDDGTIYFGSRDHQFYAVTPGGRLKWKFATAGWVDSSPALAADGTVYFGSWDKNFYALNPNGSLKWKFEVGGIVDSSPAIGVDGTIYFGAHNKKFYALDASGKTRWIFSTEAEITSSPAIDSDGSVCFGSTDGNLYRLKADGTEMWHCRTGSGANGSPVIAENGNVVIAAAHNTFIISSVGKILWTHSSPNWVDETPAIAQGTICFADSWVQVAAVQSDGNGLWIAKVMSTPTSSPVIDAQGQIYLGCGGYLEALQPPVALAPAKSPWPMFRGDARHTGRVRVE